MMNKAGPSRTRSLFLALAVLAALAVHVIVLHQFASRVAPPTALLTIIVVFVLVQHLRLFKRRS
jgi:hypothetical protein